MDSQPPLLPARGGSSGGVDHNTTSSAVDAAAISTAVAGDGEDDACRDEDFLDNDNVMFMTNLTHMDSVIHGDHLSSMADQQPASQGASPSALRSLTMGHRLGTQMLLPPLLMRSPVQGNYQHGMLYGADVLPGLLLGCSPPATIAGCGGVIGINGGGGGAAAAAAYELIGRVSLHAPQPHLGRPHMAQHAAALPSEASFILYGTSSESAAMAPSAAAVAVASAAANSDRPLGVMASSHAAAAAAAAGAIAAANLQDSPPFSIAQRAPWVVWTSRRYALSPEEGTAPLAAAAPSEASPSRTQTGPSVGVSSGPSAVGSGGGGGGAVVQTFRPSGSSLSHTSQQVQRLPLSPPGTSGQPGQTQPQQQQQQQPATLRHPHSQLQVQLPFGSSASAVPPPPSAAPSPSVSSSALARVPDTPTAAAAATARSASVLRDVSCKGYGPQSPPVATVGSERASGGSSAASNLPSSTLAGSTMSPSGASTTPSACSPGTLASPSPSPTVRSLNSNVQGSKGASLAAKAGRASGGGGQLYGSIDGRAERAASTASAVGYVAASGGGDDGDCTAADGALARWKRTARDMGLAASIARGFRTLRNQHDENLIEEEQLHVLARLGEGTFAQVDKCIYSPSDGAKPFLVAVKRIKEAMLFMDHDPEDVLLFIQEAQLLRKLNHPHIVQYIGIGFVTAGSGLLNVNPFEALGHLTAATARRRRSSVESFCSATDDPSCWPPLPPASPPVPPSLPLPLSLPATPLEGTSLCSEAPTVSAASQRNPATAAVALATFIPPGPNANRIQQKEHVLTGGMRLAANSSSSSSKGPHPHQLSHLNPSHGSRHGQLSQPQQPPPPQQQQQQPGQQQRRPAGPVSEKVHHRRQHSNLSHPHPHPHPPQQQYPQHQQHQAHRRRASSGQQEGVAAEAAEVASGLMLRGLFIVEEFLAGGTLKDVVRQQMRQPKRQLYSNGTALQWMAQIASALSYMHTCRPKVLHRDIKLDNLLLTSPQLASTALLTSTQPSATYGGSGKGPGKTASGAGTVPAASGSNSYTGVSGPPAAARYPAATPLEGTHVKLSDLGLAALVAHHRPKQQGQGQAPKSTSAPGYPGEMELLDFEQEPVAQVQPSEASRVVRQRVQAATLASPLLRAAGDEEVLSRLLDTHASGRLGTYMYMAPEVQRRQKYDEKCDCFSFAVVMYEVFHRYILACSLEVPQQMEDYARQVAHGFRPAIHEDLPAELRRLIRRCWAHEPAARPDMAAVAAELQTMIAGGVVAGLDRRQQAGPACGGCCVIS